MIVRHICDNCGHDGKFGISSAYPVKLTNSIIDCPLCITHENLEYLLELNELEELNKIEEELLQHYQEEFEELVLELEEECYY